MQVIIKVKKSVVEYIRDVNDRRIEKPCKCPVCGEENSLHHNGTYIRNLIDENKEYQIPIIRLFCKYCLKTVSLLPEFCLPRFQYSFDFILRALKLILTTSVNRVEEKFRALFLFYKKRFIKYIPIYIQFLRECHFVHNYPNDEKEKAIKVYYELTSLSPEVNLSLRLFNYTNKHFMAK